MICRLSDNGNNHYHIYPQLLLTYWVTPNEFNEIMQIIRLFSPSLFLMTCVH